jgi:hypothetical protein
MEAAVCSFETLYWDFGEGKTNHKKPVTIAPVPAQSEHLTPYEPACSAWQRKSPFLRCDVL